MTRIVKRSNFRVAATLRQSPATNLFPGADGWALAEGITITVRPKQLGDFGPIRLPDQMVSRDIPRAYEELCKELQAQLRELPHVLDTKIVCDEVAVCSHCDHVWEEVDEEYARKYPEDLEPGDRVGLPLCCAEAQEEWREEHVPLCTYQNSGFYPNTPPEHCDLEAEPDSEYCAVHGKRIAELEALVEATGTGDM